MIAVVDTSAQHVTCSALIIQLFGPHPILGRVNRRTFSVSRVKSSKACHFLLERVVAAENFVQMSWGGGVCFR